MCFWLVSRPQPADLLKHPFVCTGESKEEETQGLLAALVKDNVDAIHRWRQLTSNDDITAEGLSHTQTSSAQPSAAGTCIIHDIGRDSGGVSSQHPKLALASFIHPPPVLRLPLSPTGCLADSEPLLKLEPIYPVCFNLPGTPFPPTCF